MCGTRLEIPRFEMIEIKDRVEVSDVEHKIFDELLDAVRQASATISLPVAYMPFLTRHLPDHRRPALQAGLGTTLRCAGGWVRDKLMGRQSLDIDIALDNMLGREFAERVNEHLASKVSVEQ